MGRVIKGIFYLEDGMYASIAGWDANRTTTAGWDEGILTMKLGEKATLDITR